MSGWMPDILLHCIQHCIAAIIDWFSCFLNNKDEFSEETNSPPLITDFNWAAKLSASLQGTHITAPLLTHGRFHEQPQRQRRSRPRGSECNSSAGGTSLSLEHILGNRKDHTTQIIVFGITDCTALWYDRHCMNGLSLLCLSSWNNCSLIAYEKYKLSHCFDFEVGFQFSHICWKAAVQG